MSLSKYLDKFTSDSKKCLVDSTSIQHLVKPIQLPDEYLSLKFPIESLEVGKKKIYLD